MKTRDTMRQEEMAAHIIAEIDSILKADKIPSILQCYEVLAFSDHDGMIDYLDGFLSLHEIKKTINELGFDCLGVIKLCTFSIELFCRGVSRKTRLIS